MLYAAEPITTAAELAEHSTQADCWTAIHGVVYDVTTFLAEHPGEPLEKALGVAAADIPASTSRGKETFFDGKIFDPENPSAYLKSLSIKRIDA
mgnify:CR=1 FL=1